MPDDSLHRNVWDRMFSSDTFLITTHIRPDGDGIASELALKIVLTSLGKEVRILNQDPTPEMYAWLPGVGDIEVYSGKMKEDLSGVDCAVLLDCSSASRIGTVFDAVQKAKTVVCVDHHENTQCLGDASFIDPAASSIGEMLFRLVPDLDANLSRDIATCLYTSILTDTGSFANANTTGRVFGIVKRLVEAGADPELIHRKTYRNKRLVYFRLLSRAIDRLRTFEDGKVAYTSIPGEVYDELDADDNDTEGILDVMKTLRGVQLTVMLRQMTPHEVKASLRSTDHVDCSYLAGLYGGGGHVKASGFSMTGTVEEVGRPIIDRLVEVVRNRGWI